MNSGQMHIGSLLASAHSVSLQLLGLLSAVKEGLVLTAAGQMQLGSTGVTAHSLSLHLRRLEGGAIGPDGFVVVSADSGSS
jgi:hypothetical protein